LSHSDAPDQSKKQLFVTRHLLLLLLLPCSILCMNVWLVAV
jgi:hypothetical protein